MSNDPTKQISAIKMLMLRDLDETTDAQLQAELSEDVKDPDILDRELAEGLDSIAAEFMRNRVAAFKAVRKATETLRPIVRPNIETIKQLVKSAFQHDVNLAAAYREGTRQTEDDLITIYDDLISLGKIESHTHDKR